MNRRALPVCGEYVRLCGHSAEVGCVSLGTNAGTAGESVRETAGEQQEESRNVVAEPRGKGVCLRAGCVNRCLEVAAGAPAVLLPIAGNPDDYPEAREKMGAAEGG